MAKLSRKHGQTVPLLDDSPASGSALKKKMNNIQSPKKDSLNSESITRLEKLLIVSPKGGAALNVAAPGVPAAAVSTAMRADVIIVAARAGEGMPLAFYTWINAWLPNRFQSGGVLAALLGKAECSDARPGRVGEYLREVARQGRMSFLFETRKLQMEANGANGFAHSSSNNGAARMSNQALASVRF